MYNGTYIVLNKILWDINFRLPKMPNQMKVFQEGTHMEYIVIGEMCHKRNLEDRYPEEKYESLMMFFKRDYIDVLWSRELENVSGKL